MKLLRNSWIPIFLIGRTSVSMHSVFRGRSNDFWSSVNSLNTNDVLQSTHWVSAMRSHAVLSALIKLFSRWHPFPAEKCWADRLRGKLVRKSQQGIPYTGRFFCCLSTPVFAGCSLSPSNGFVDTACRETTIRSVRIVDPALALKLGLSLINWRVEGLNAIS